MKKLHIALFALLALAFSAHAEWTYTAGEGTKNKCPYSGIISNGNWQIYVYRPDASSNDFWLGCGGNGTGARVAGSGDLDLSTLLDDTTAAGTPVRAVNVAPFFFKGVGDGITSLVLPSTVTNIGNVAFENCKNTSVDLRNTSIRSIQGFAFAWNQNLSEVWLPETLEHLGKCAFRTMPNKVVVHFAGDVPWLAPPTDPNTGSNYSKYISDEEYQNIFYGDGDRQWAFCVNAEKYPNWTRIGKATYYDEENPFPSGEATWVPSAAQAIDGYTAPFGNTWFSRTSDTSASGRSYLIQEGSWTGETVARPMFGESVVEAKRYAVTNTIPLFIGSSTSVTVTYTFNGVSTEQVVTSDTNLVFGVDGLADSTTYAWSVSATGSSGTDSLEGEVTTLTPDIVLGDPSYTITKDGKTAEISIPVTSLVSESGLLEFMLDGHVVFETNIVETGTYSFSMTDLVLGNTYAFTIYGTAGVDEDSKTISFVAERYKWTYTPGSGTKNKCPYTGTISDKNWTIYVYQPDSGSDAFWLGCGGDGTASRVAGSGELDLTPVLADTAEDGTPVRLVRVARHAFNSVAVSSVVLPNTVTNIGQMAFQNSGLYDVDLSQTKVKSVEAFAFAWNQSCTNVVFPKTLSFIGGFAFRCLSDKTVFHFAGRPPQLELLNSNPGSNYGSYVTFGTYQNLYRGGDNKQWALCVDYKMFPEWTTLDTNLWTTTYYLPVAPGNAFPSGEASWIPKAVRYTVNEDYDAPFGTTNFGRSSDTSANGRSYLIFEKHGDVCTMILVK